jgi:hypothetical protein
MFLMLWTAKECREKFYTLVESTFGKSKQFPAYLDYVQKLFLLCIDEGKYNSLAIQRAFEVNLYGSPPKMFNPLASDTKVAVISAPVHAQDTSILCNYNGLNRPSKIGYRILRSADAADEITVDEA